MNADLEFIQVTGSTYQTCPECDRRIPTTKYQRPVTNYMQNKPNVKIGKNESKRSNNKGLRRNMWIGTMKNQSLAKPIEAKAANLSPRDNQSSLINNHLEGKPNTKPIRTQLLQRPKMSANIYYIKVYNNETASGSRKNKPKQTQSRINFNARFF